MFFRPMAKSVICMSTFKIRDGFTNHLSSILLQKMDVQNEFEFKFL